MKLTCPSCDTRLRFHKMDIDADEAVCSKCGERSSISEQLGHEAPVRQTMVVPDSFDLRQAPSGVSFENEGLGWRITATIRSGIGYFLFLFAIIFGIAAVLIVLVPQINAGKFDLMESLFGIPFVGASLLMGTISLFLLFGETKVEADQRDPDVGRIFVGLGSLGWSRNVRWSEVTQIEETDSGGTVNDRPIMQITLHRDQGDIHFGALLSKPRLHYVMYALTQLVTLSPVDR